MKVCTNKITGWTDYPFEELGDPKGPAPIRHVEVVSYDGDKYVTAVVIGTDGPLLHFKSGYLYRKPGRVGSVKAINPDKLSRAFGFDTIGMYTKRHGYHIKRMRDGSIQWKL